MPAKLKRLFAHAAAGRKPFDPGRVRRQQQVLLYGGGSAVTAFVLVCAALVVRLDVQDSLGQARSTFLQREAEFYANLQTVDRVLATFGTRTELLWNQGARPSTDALRGFSAGHGRLVAATIGGGEPFFAMAEVTAARPAESYARYLGALLPQADRGLRYAPRPAEAEPIGGYLIGLDSPFLGVVGAGVVARARTLPIDTDLQALIARLMPTGATKQKPGMHGGTYSLDRRYDPIVGRTVVRFARRLDDAAGRPFGWFVFNGLFRLDDILSPQSGDEDVAIVDARGSIVVGRQRDPAMIEGALNDTRASSGGHVVVRRVGTRFVISDRLPDSDLAMVTTFSWRSVARATAVGVGTALAAALFAIAALWIAIVMFDRRALRPANRRAIRLIESEAFNRTLIRTAPAGLLLLSAADGETMVRNDAALAYDEDVSGPSLGKRIWHAYRERYPAGAGERRFVMQQELAVEHAERGTTYLAAHIVRTKFRGADVLLCTLTDVTARKLTEDKLREARAAADDANKAKSTFLATMSHEIRTPLNAIVGNLELMERADLPAVERRRLETIASSSDALLRTINDVLDLSKAESNQMALEHIPFDLRRVLRDVAAIFRPLAEAKGLVLDCHLAAELADGYVGDPTRLRQLVSNLVGNAIKFTEHGMVTVGARLVRSGAGAGCVEIGVRDTGVGIPGEALPTLFDVYMQADPSIYRRFGGTGLGLPLCRRIARLMHGELTVESQEGEGSTFTAMLPLTEAPAGWRGAEPELDAAHAAPIPDRHEGAEPLRVLVAEDHPASRALLRDQLDALGHDATIVENGMEAMRAYFAQPFDVVLTDLSMPQLDGFALANFLREQGAQVPVIAMTAHATDEDKRRCAQVGVAEVVIKPLSIDSLDAALRRHGSREGAAADAMDAGVREAVPVMTGEIRRTLREATLRSLAVIETAVSAGDTDSLRVELHSMRGGFALAGESAARDACAEMEVVVNTGGAVAFESRWPAFRRTLEQAVARIDR
ncbi:MULTISPECIES: hybrid sensor histidine kinase/response regulator [Burkholderia]|uniref:Virulence sensor protein BvgS n=1 Tax=Burkholderia contaminans TaxID=488447 RepID=A0A2S5E3Z2_9BURK|nr:MULTISPECIES: hybrid sensor histidine kinase/response regulator [Burkholderia]EKS9798748.1 response regulator [Burkholderia cepacia]EKS9803160.1 response regulator [Burkholderia cepacia]EKS9810644.1 response regulator [Burkholderia cepacia]EKS9819625.1 response regulator [Burkholderia cepacia]EKS9827243.1 response regulator [Burkholderia cepacia]